MPADFPSSNPFGRKPSTAYSTSLEDPSTSISTSTSTPTSNRAQIICHQIDPPSFSQNPQTLDAPKKVTKKVRVQSPTPSSPIPSSTSTIDEESYPIRNKLETATAQEDPFDSITSEISEDEDAGQKTHNRAPANPFSKTLETMEHPERGAPISPPHSVMSPGRASLDVDAFKRLLMTGNAGLSTLSPPLLAYSAHHTVDGGSSTDASSISRQSIFEAIHEVPHQSPRTSHEISEPDDDSRGSLSDLNRSASGRKKPPPPSSRHGRLIKLELRDDGPVLSLNSPSTPNSVTDKQFSYSPVISNLNRSLTDLNKPLPLAPKRPSHESDRESIFDKESAGKTPESPSPPSSVRRKTPPAPPITRRRSQMVSDSKLGRSKSGRLSPKVEEDDRATSSLAVTGRPRSDSARAPPPPPTRRPASTRGSSYQTPLSSPSTVSLPAPPPARRSSRKSISSRPPSVSSFEISSSSRRASVLAPPPPPPRGMNYLEAPLGGNSRTTSGEQPGQNADHLRHSSRSSSLSHYEPTGVEESQTGALDILADLGALQREIDALRIQSERENIT